MSLFVCVSLDVEKRKSPVCGFVTPLEGSEADSHRKPEVMCTKLLCKFRRLCTKG